MKGKISLAGDLGSGKSTVSNILIERLGASYYSTGAIVRSIAASRGMGVAEFNVYMEAHPEIDREIDDGLVKLAEKDELMIIDSRLAWHFTRGTFKVYLSTDITTSALRIMHANRSDEHRSTLEETIDCTKNRRESEKKRYKEQYGVDIKDLLNYDLIVDTTEATPDQVADAIADGFNRWLENGGYKSALISPERINYPDREADNELVASYSSALDLGESIPEVKVFEEDGEFYLLEGLESALAHAFNMDTFIPATLVYHKRGDEEYIRMQNSL
jgi:cytidylate kinase